MVNFTRLKKSCSIDACFSFLDETVYTSSHHSPIYHCMLSLPENEKVHIWRTELPGSESLPVSQQKELWKQQTHQWIQNVLKSQYGISPPESIIGYQSNGQPYFENLKYPMHISISYSFEISTFALSQNPTLGIDLEKRLPQKNLSFLWDQLNVTTDKLTATDFYVLWTELEAFTKAKSCSLWQTQWATQQLLSLPFENKLSHGVLNDESWYFYTDKNDKSVVSVAVKSEEPISVEQYDGITPHN